MTQRTATPHQVEGVAAPADGGIVVGVDESMGAAAALRWAVREAEARRARLTAVLAWDFLDQHRASAGAPFDPGYTRLDAMTALRAIVVAAVGHDRAAAVGLQAVCDLPAPALLDASSEADLLVVGARGLGRTRELLLGSVSQQCLQHASCPVAVVHDVPERRSGKIERIVVGIDASTTARRALDWALSEARVHQATIECVHAWTFHDGATYPFVNSVGDSAPMEKLARMTLDVAVDAADANGLPTPLLRTLTFGSAAAVLLDAAADADLIVVGSRGLGGFKGLLLGSVSYKTVHRATCPVVVVPPDVELHDTEGSDSLVTSGLR